MDNVLADIIDEKHLEVQALAAAKDFSTLDLLPNGTPPRGFAAALSRDAGRGYGLIAELKKALHQKAYSG